MVHGVEAMTPSVSPETKSSDKTRLKRSYSKRHVHRKEAMEEDGFERQYNFDSEGVFYGDEQFERQYNLYSLEADYTDFSKGLGDQKSYVHSMDFDGVVHVVEANPSLSFHDTADCIKRFYYKR